MGSAVIHRRKASYHNPADGRSNNDMVTERKNNVTIFKIHRQE